AAAPRRLAEPMTLTALVNPVLFGEYAALYSALKSDLEKSGITLKALNSNLSEYIAGISGSGSDVHVGRWNADYFDSDNFAYLVHSREGVFSSYCASAELDRLIERGRAESDPSIRHAVYRQV